MRFFSPSFCRQFGFSILFAGALLALSGCGSSNEPSTSEYEKKLALDLKGYIEVASFEKQVSENTGTKVEPVIMTRFKAKLALKEDTYMPVGTVKGASLIELRNKKGTEFDIYGVAKATKRGDSWNITYRFENQPTNTGQPRSFFDSSGKVVVKGSPEEASLLEELKKQEEIADAARQMKIAEDQKKATEERAKNAVYEKALKSVVVAKRTYQGILKRGDFITAIHVSFSAFNALSGTFSGKLYMERIPRMEKLANASNRFRTEGFRTFEIVGNISDGRLRFTMEHDINHYSWDGLGAIVESKFVLKPDGEQKISGSLSKGGDIAINL